MEKLKKNPEKYLKELNLDKEYLDALRNAYEIKITPGLDYTPAIYAGGETDFNLNIGRTAFRNGQPDFKQGLLTNWNRRRHKYLTLAPKTDEVLDDEADQKAYGEDDEGIEKEHDYDIESVY